MRVLAVDPSLTSTGIIVLDSNKNCLRDELVGYTISQSSSVADRIQRDLIIARKIIDVGKEPFQGIPIP